MLIELTEIKADLKTRPRWINPDYIESMYRVAANNRGEMWEREGFTHILFAHGGSCDVRELPDAIAAQANGLKAERGEVRSEGVNDDG